MAKKVIVYLLSAVIIVTVVYGCGNSQKSSEDRSSNIKLELKKIGEFTIGEENVTLDRVRDLPAANPDESMMAWVNSDKNKIVITDRKGDLLSKFGQRGRGPRKFSNISAYGFNNDSTVIVYDWNQDFFKKFNINGELLWIEKGLLKDKLWIRSDRIITYNGNMFIGIQESGSNPGWTSNTIAKYNEKGQLLSLFGRFDPALKSSDQQLYTNLNSITFDPIATKIYTTHRTLPLYRFLM